MFGAVEPKGKVMMYQPFMKTRREFLGNCGVAAVGATMPQFLTHTAHSAATAEGWEPGSAAALPGFKDDHILVVIQLPGGNDGLNTIIPHDDDTYYRLRPRLNIKRSQALRLDDDLSFNKNLMSLKEVYDEGHLAVIEGIGYPNPNRSHFRSMEIWQTASESERSTYSGWNGRYFDNFCSLEAIPPSGF